MPQLRLSTPVSDYIETTGVLQKLAGEKQRQEQMADRHGLAMQSGQVGLERQKGLAESERMGRQHMMQEQLYQDIAIGAAYADTPEKWNQVIDHFVQRGLTDAEDYRDQFDKRELFVQLGSPQTRDQALGAIQSSKILPGGFTQSITKGGDIQVKDATGKLLTGQEAINAIRKAENRGIEIQGGRAGERTRRTLEERLKREPELQAEITKAKEEAKAKVADQVKKEGQLSKLEDADRIYKDLSQADLGKIYGRGESLWPELLRSQEGIDLMTKRDQLLGMLQLAAAGDLKGQGQITENERLILKQAMTILSNPNISPEAARESLDAAMRLLYNKAGKTFDENQNEAPQAAIDYLKQNPQVADQFQAKYGYLPEGF